MKLYGAITRLAEQGWIRPLESKERRHPYRITPAGKRDMEEQLAVLGKVVRTGLRRLREE